jgi:type IV pilus assembly protein PilB
MTEEKLRELLVDPGFIEAGQFDEAAKIAIEHSKDLSELLIDKDLIKDEQLGQLIAGTYQIPFANLRDEKIDDSLLEMVPELVASSHGVIVFGMDAQGFKVGMTEPDDVDIKHLLEKRLGGAISPYYITRRGLHEALGRYKIGLKNEFHSILEKLKSPSLSREERDEVTVNIVDLLLKYGYESKASDIHIEPHLKTMVVRFRIDGVMHDVLNIQRGLLDLISTRIKILSGMRTDEHRAAQDGKLTFESAGDKVDVRVSVVPVTEGENVVMRLLAAKSRQYSLTDLGLSERDYSRVMRSVRNPHGMILVTGPTGSGKTTSIYAMLKVLNTRSVHIATIEDPVEYDIEGVSQIQVNPRTNLTFAKGLRAIVRQDPDIIMVGEIRDEETAGIAVNSAMTGHLVLSTLHANDAATTLPRLLDMAIEPFLVASTINVVLAQRLVRKICNHCRESHEITNEEKELIAGDTKMYELLANRLEGLRLYKGKGCKACGDTGYSGRIGIFEVLEMSDLIKKQITARSPSGDIMKTAVSEGMTTMLEDGVAKVFKGVTTLEEVLRVTKS